MENCLKQLEERFPGLFEVVAEGVLILDMETQKFVSHNESALKMLKFSNDEMLLQGPASISPEFQPDGRRSDEKAMEVISRTINGERPVFEWLIKDGKGELRFFEARLAFLSGQGNAGQIYASFIDITERKKGEEKLMRLHKQLEQVAFLQSHQVRSPIANIMGLISLFNFNDLNDPLNSELILKIKAVSSRFDDLIRKITTETKKVDSLTFGCGKGEAGICDPSALCSSIKSCFRESKSE